MCADSCGPDDYRGISDPVIRFCCCNRCMIAGDAVTLHPVPCNELITLTYVAVRQQKFGRQYRIEVQPPGIDN